MIAYAEERANRTFRTRLAPNGFRVGPSPLSGRGDTSPWQRPVRISGRRIESRNWAVFRRGPRVTCDRGVETASAGRSTAPDPPSTMTFEGGGSADAVGIRGHGMHTSSVGEPRPAGTPAGSRDRELSRSSSVMSAALVDAVPMVATRGLRGPEVRALGSHHGVPEGPVAPHGRGASGPRWAARTAHPEITSSAAESESPAPRPARPSRRPRPTCCPARR